MPPLALLPAVACNVRTCRGCGDEAVVRWTAHGTHTGDGLGLPPTGRSISLRGLTWIRTSGGKLLEGWDCWNFREMLESLR